MKAFSIALVIQALALALGVSAFTGCTTTQSQLGTRGFSERPLFQNHVSRNEQ